MTDPTYYSASITRSNGISIYVSIEAPVGLPDEDIEDLAGITQMAASHANGVIKRGEMYRAARARRDEAPF